MANEIQDEEYLETLLNSIVNSDEEMNLSSNEEADEKFGNEDGLESVEENEQSKGTDDNEESNTGDAESDEKDSEMIEDDFDKWLEDEIKKEDLSDEIDIDELVNEENNDIGEIINSMYSGDEDVIPDENNVLKQKKKAYNDEKINRTEELDKNDNIDEEDNDEMAGNLTDIDSLINHDINSNGKKKKKDSFFKKLFTEKEKKNDMSENLDTEKILSETGSTSEDMSKLDLKSEKDLFGELEKLDELDELAEKKEKKEKKKKAKRKKEKKKVKSSREKELKIRKRKEKPLVKEEIIKISPISVIFMATIIAVVVIGVYFGANIFNYNSKINKASSYYVDKEYEKAYDVLAGMDLKKNDEGFYNQVINIMLVEKHLNDFYSYMAIKLYANALESLLKGVENYDANIGASNELGTTEILNSILNDIDTALQNYYGLSVEEARTIIQIGNKSEIARIINDKSVNVKTGNN